MIHQNRRKKLLSQFAANSLLIISTNSQQQRSGDVNYPFRPDSDFWYLTGFTEPEAVAVFSDKTQIIFLRDKDSKSEIWDGEMLGVAAAAKALGFDLAYDIKKLNSIFPTLLGDFQNYYYDFKTTDFDNIISPLLPAAKSLKPYLAEMRIVKSAEEIRLMKLAAEISVTAHKQAMQQACGGLFEYEIASLFDGYFRKNNAEHAYTPIVAGGKNACVLHYIKNNQRLNSGELLLIDAGCEVEGYAADISRTFPVNGKFTSAQAEIYQIVLNAQKAAIESICPNEIVTQPHQIALKIIQQGLLDLGILQAGDDVKKFYMHNTGHWLGLDVHDSGEYKINQQPRRFAAGMVITVEPGIYIRKDAKIDPIYWNIGVRIEDDVLVTENGNSVLSGELPKEINEIEKLMSKKIKQII